MGHSFTGNTDTDLEWTIKTFEPIYEKLNLQEKEDFILEELHKYPACVKAGLVDCVIAIQFGTFPEQHAMGLFTLSRDEETGIFFLLIQLNYNLFKSQSEQRKILQKTTITHEFLHCIAALLARSCLENDALIDKFLLTVKEKSMISTTVEILQLQQSLSKKPVSFISHPDEHYRLGFEDFPISYTLVFDEILLPWSLVKKYLTNEEDKKKFVDTLLEESAEKAIKDLSNIIAKNNNLDNSFVEKRLKTDKILLKISKQLQSALK